MEAGDPGTRRSGVHPGFASLPPVRVSLASLGTRGREKRGAEAMESGPAIFAGIVFALFGGGLMVWIATRLRQRRPVAHGVNPIASAAFASVAALLALTLGAWCFTRL
jgi:hypothetical protein